MAGRQPGVGDVFTVLIDDDRIGFGQVAAKYLREGYYFVVFAPAYPISAQQTRTVGEASLR